MAINCECVLTLANLGKESCPSAQDVARKLILVPLFDSTGNLNKLTKLEIRDLAAWTPKLTNTNPIDRFYPMVELLNVTDEREDAIFQTFTGGQESFVRDGNRKFQAIGVNQGPKYLGKVEEWRGEDFGAYIVDISAGITYETCPEEPLDAFPIRIDGASWNPQYIKKKDDESSAVMIQFNWDVSSLDKNLETVRLCDLNFNPLKEVNFFGLIDGDFVASNITVNGATLEITDCFGTPITGLLIGDMTFTDDTAMAGITLTSFTETPVATGTYIVVYSSAIPSDANVVNPEVTAIIQNGIDFTPFNAGTYNN